MNNESFHFYIKVRTALSIRPTITHSHYTFFGEGQDEVEEKDRSGRPVTETTAINIEQVQISTSDGSHDTTEEAQIETDF